MKTLLYKPLFINPQAYYVFPNINGRLEPKTGSGKEPAIFVGNIEVRTIAYGDTSKKQYFYNTNEIDLSAFSGSLIRISLYTSRGNVVLGEWNLDVIEQEPGDYIDPEVLDSLCGVWIMDQNTNESESRNIIKNKIADRGGDLELLNFAYKANSGYNGYLEDFTSWNYNTGLIVSPIKVQNNGDAGRQLIYYHTSIRKEDVLEFKVKITLDEQSKIKYWYIKEDGTSANITYSESGTYTIPTSYFSKYTGENTWFGFEQLSGGCIIEQLPLYEGALVTDGKDDMIVSQKTVQEMLGGSNVCTVVSMIHQINLSAGVNTSINNIRSESVAHVCARHLNTAYGKTGIFGYSKQLNTPSNPTLINNILGDKKDYIADGASVIDTTDKYFVQGYKYNDSLYELSEVAVYWTFISNKVLTTDEINQIIAYFKLDKYVTPQVIYDVKRQGLTNDTPDADWYLKDFSGNGRDMQLYNYGKTPESGINEEGGLQSDGVTDFGKVENLPIYKDYTVVADREIVDGLIDNANGGVATRSYNYAKGAFGFDWKNQAFSFGGNTDRIIDVQRFISYQSKYVNNGIQLITGNVVDNNPLYMARLGEENRYSKLALWSFLLFPYTLSEFLLERQLKRYKLGTLYPDMVEVRPIVKSNTSNYLRIEYRNGQGGLIQPGSYLPVGSILRISVVMKDDTSEVSSLKVDGVDIPETNYSNGRFYIYDATVTKSPQKIDITIDEYVRYEDIVQPYPAIINLKQDGKTITWGDKLKVGSDIVFVGSANLLPELYTVSETQYNGVTLYPNTIIKVEKSMVFDNARTYLKANEPSCILSPNRLRIPNSSYKILRYIPDLTGKGNHGRLNNFAYAGMSGANGYVEDFTKWSKNSSLDDIEITYDRIKVNKLTGSTVLYVTSNKFINKIKIVASGIPNGGKLTFTQYPDNAIENNKEFEIGGVTTTGSWGFSIKEGLNLNWSNLIIQQIGEHEGSICFDGTDDHITIPTLAHGGKCVMMKVNWSNGGMLYDQRLNSSTYTFGILTSEALPAYNARNNGSTYIDGILNTSIIPSDLVGITHNITAVNDAATDNITVSPRLGVSVSNATFSNMSLYEFMLFPEIPSEDEIKKLNDIIGIEGNTDDLLTKINI